MTTDAELRERVARLEDRAEIHECMMRYARGMDRRDRELLRSAYHDGAGAWPARIAHAAQGAGSLLRPARMT